MSANRRPVIHRRDVLQLGALGACGLSLPALLQSNAEARSRPKQTKSDNLGSAKSCIMLIQQGGPARLPGGVDV
jgi:hypothetical protein